MLMRVLFVLLLSLLLVRLAAADLNALPVLHQGRVKPFAVAAEEALLAVSGTTRLSQTETPGVTLVSLIDDPRAWVERPLVYVPWLALRGDLGLGPAEQRATLHQVQRLQPRLEAIVKRRQELDASGLRGGWNPDDQALLTLADRFQEALALASGETIQLTPLAVSDAERAWVIATLGPKLAGGTNDRSWRMHLREVLAKPDQQAERLKEADIWLSWSDLVHEPDPLLADAPADLAQVVTLARELGPVAGTTGEGLSSVEPPLRAALRSRGQARDADLGTHAFPSSTLVDLELLSGRVHPFTIAWIGFLLGGIAVAAGLGGRRVWYASGLALTGLAIAATVAGLAVRTAISGLGAVTNLYETLIYVGLIVAVLGLVFTRMSGRGIYAVAGGVGAALCAMIGEAMPPDLGQHIGQLQPVLRSKFWLWIHVKVVVGAYAPLVLALVLGNFVLTKAWWQKRAVTHEESHLLYRCLQWGTVLMAAGTLLGAVWADQAWGRFWGWDPKEVGALLIVLTYLIPLHLRYVGAVGPTGLAAWSVLGFLSVVWSWYGVNFLLGAGLHAYASADGAFGSGGQLIVLPLAGVQIVVTVAQLIAIRRAARRLPAGGSAPAS